MMPDAVPNCRMVKELEWTLKPNSSKYVVQLPIIWSQKAGALYIKSKQDSTKLRADLI